MTASGGIIALVGSGIAAIFAFSEAANRATILVACSVSALGTLAVIYDCGRRILDAEEKLRVQQGRDDLGGLLVLLEGRLVKIRNMKAEHYEQELSVNHTDVSTMALLEGIRAVIEKSHGPADAAFFTSVAEIEYPNVDPSHPKAFYEQKRISAVANLVHFSRQLQKLISRRDA